VLQDIPHLGEHGETIIALGSNAASPWGNPIVTVSEAVNRIERMFDAAGRTSKMYQTPAFPIGSGPAFINAVAVFRTALSPLEILNILHQIEAEADRERTVRWGQRTLDLDLIACGDLVLPDADTHSDWRNLALSEQMERAPDELILPHPRMQDRAFVLQPLRDVAPDWVHPVFGVSVAALLQQCSVHDRDSVVPIDAADIELQG
jgi:2-amino-4-hydroxy-6-hydroxymethyldihydropteridine diphosphokinase